VRIQVRVPAASAPAEELVYLLIVHNTASAPAYNVTVRNPLPVTAEFVSADPPPEKNSAPSGPVQLPADLGSPAGQKPPTASEATAVLTWKLGTLTAGEQRLIRLKLRPKAEAKEVRNLAYVSYEYGQAVVTRIEPPRLQLTKTAPSQVVRDEPVLIRVVVSNPGKVVVNEIRVVENLPASAQVEPVTPGGQRSAPTADTPAGQQWIWQIPRLFPGQQQVIEYRLTPRESRDVLALTHASAAGQIQEKAEARLAVLTPGLSIQWNGSPGQAPIAPGDSARLEILVRNTGTLPAVDVRVRATIPPDCKPVRKTAGGQWQGDALIWWIPRLEPGQARTFRYELKATTTGRRRLLATVTDRRGQQAQAELAVLFQGIPALSWETIPQPVTLRVGQSGMLTIRLRNNGGETARQLRLEVELPQVVAFRSAQPPGTTQGHKLLFSLPSLAPASESIVTIHYDARQAAQAFFRLRLLAEHLGEIPMQTEKAIEIFGDTSSPTNP
jgi:uncharacterized repeat protein (TIGR01451 family)